jgi:hypothetical protein
LLPNSTLVSYSNPSLLQRFSSYGANLFSDSSEFITGNANESIVVLTLIASTHGSVSYAFGPTSGILREGTTETVYILSGMSVTLVATPSSFLYEFSGWSGAFTSNKNLISVVVNMPISLRASFNYNYVNIVSLSLMICLGLIIVVSLGAMAIRYLRRARSRKSSSRVYLCAV